MTPPAYEGKGKIRHTDTARRDATSGISFTGTHRLFGDCRSADRDQSRLHRDVKRDAILPNICVLHWCKENTDAVVGHANGSTLLEIIKSNLRLLGVAVPSDSGLTNFTELHGSLYRQPAESECESRSLAELRDTLLPKLISGAIRINDAATFLKGRGL